jgi:DNA-binding MarR family transcriptional regulator
MPTTRSDTPRIPKDLLDVADRLHSAAIVVLRHVRGEDAASGLTAARLSALSVVVFAGPVTIGQLAHAEQVSAPTTSRMIAGMEQEGLVRREPDLADRRVVWIHPTEEGSRVLREGRRRRVQALARALATVSTTDRKQIARTAERLLATLSHR